MGKLFQPWRKGKTEQMGDTEDDFGETVRIGRMNVAFNDFMVEQPVNDVSRFTLGGADDRRIKKQMSFVNKTVNRHALIVSEVFE